jgi:hypothetical protein
LQRTALKWLLDESARDAILRKERRRLVEIFLIPDLEAQPIAGGNARLAKYQRVMLMFFASAQIDGSAVAILDMETDGVFVEFAARIQIHHVKHRVAASDDVEGRIEYVLRNGHQKSLG